MKKSNYWVLAILTMLAMPACKKKEQPMINNTTQPITQEDDYMQMNVGNSWIYRYYFIDSNGVETSTNDFDSVCVSKDTIMNDRHYFQYCRFKVQATAYLSEVSYMRDSNGYWVNHTGRIIFSSKDVTSVYRTYTYGPSQATPDTFLVTEKMGDIGKQIAVEAGLFTTYAFIRTYLFQSGANKGKTMVDKSTYAKNVGLVTDNILYSFTRLEKYERRLVRYRVYRVVS